VAQSLNSSAPAPKTDAATQEPDPLSDQALSKDEPRIDMGAFKTKWGTLTRQQKEGFMNGLSAEQQVQLYTMMGGGRDHHATVSATPQFGMGTIGKVLTGRAEEDPWVRQKSADLLYRTINYLPAIGGTAGGIGGGIAGEAVWPAGGGAVGGMTGAFLGGAGGEAARQGSLHALGWDKYEEPMTGTQRGTEMAKAGIENAVMELVGRGMGNVMRPTLDRAIKKLYYAGGLEHGDPMAEGSLESIFPELQGFEKASPVRSNKDLVDLISKTKRTIGQQVDFLYATPVQQGGRTVQLGDTLASPTPIANSVQNLINRFNINPDINQPAIKMLNEVKLLAQKPRTYRQLADWRIQINDQLKDFYAQFPPGQRVTLSRNPDLLALKEVADAIRDVSYPAMDQAAHLPPGTTAQLQLKRGVAMDLEKQALAHRDQLLTKSKQMAGAAPWRRGNMSGYVTSKGKVGAGIHRATSILHAPNILRDADKRAASAFGHTLPQKVFKAASSKPGMAAMMALPRIAMTPHRGPTPDVNAPQETEPEQATPVQQPAPSPTPTEAQQKWGQTPGGAVTPTTPVAPATYKVVRMNPRTEHKIGTNDGSTWFDLQTGKQVQ
jgi:hypothetical protein